MSLSEKLFWQPDETDGYALTRVIEVKPDTIMCQRLNDMKTTEIIKEQLLQSEPRNHLPDDNCALVNLNEATLLENVKQRYMTDQIYTYVANILIAVNPYFEIPKLYSKETILKYKGKSLGVLPPHPYAISDKAYRDMRNQRASQAIVVSGESGAGKTETTKHVLRYLTETYGAEAGVIEQRILESNPLLEAFGNAKTVRNNNSSRFGKFIELAFDKSGHVSGGCLEHYILEKGRLVRQSSEERNFHFFYQLFAGASKEIRARYKLTSPDDFHYLSSGCTRYFIQERNNGILSDDQISKSHSSEGGLHDITMDDYEDFQTTMKVMRAMDIDEDTIEAIISVVAGVLHLGNIVFEEYGVQGGCRISPKTENSLEIAAKLLGLNKKAMTEALTSKKAGALKLHIALRTEDTINARDGLAKAIYDRLFELLVSLINKVIPSSEKNVYIGLLDIAGFEYFEVNSFEQFCINYCNEKLQQFFNERILKEEQIVYKREGLNVKNVTFLDNQDCIDLIEMKTTGLLALLDEESKLPGGTNEHFATEVHRLHADNERLFVPRKDKRFKNLLDSEGFLLQHFAGSVVYTTTEFIAKNNDALHFSLEELLFSSENKLIHKMHNPEETKRWTLKRLTTNTIGKLNFISVGSKFRDQLKDLIAKLRLTGTNFIRCVKPNSTMMAHTFEGVSCLHQLRFFGLTDVLVLMQQGFPSRTQFNELYDVYKPLMNKELKRLEPRMFFKALFHALGMEDNDFKFGVSKIFFRAGKFAEFDEMLTLDPDNLNKLIEKVTHWIVQYRWRRSIYGTLCVIKLREKMSYRRRMLITIQSAVRGFLAKKKFMIKLNTSRALTRMETELSEIKAAYNVLGDFKGQGIVNVDQVNYEVKQMQAKLRDWKLNQTPEELRRSLERLEANLLDVNTDYLEHKALVEMEAERRRKLEEKRASAQLAAARIRKMSAEVEFEKARRKSIQLSGGSGGHDDDVDDDDDGTRVDDTDDYDNLLIQPALINTQSASAPFSNDLGRQLSPKHKNGNSKSFDSKKQNNIFKEGGNDADIANWETWFAKVKDMGFKQLQSRVAESQDENEIRACEHVLTRRLLALKDFKNDKKTTVQNGYGQKR